MKNNILIVGCIVCLVVLASALVLMTISPVSTMVSANMTSHNWYYKPRTDGGQPTLADDAPFIDNYTTLMLGNETEKKIYLTFDAGFDNGCTKLILDTLKEKNCPATFFLTGHFMDSQPGLVKRMDEEGHIVGNHTVTHKNLATTTSKAVYQSELGGLETKYKAITGKEMSSFMRPPEGTYSESMLSILNEMNYTPVFWSFAYKDWLEDAQPAHGEAIDTILSRTHPGAVVLLHSTSATNAAILGDVIDRWRLEGYEVCSLQELYQEVLQNKPATAPSPSVAPTN